MSENNAMDTVFYLLVLILPLSALIARKLPIGQVAKMAAAWVAIFVLLILLVGQRERLRPAWEAVTDFIGGYEQTVTAAAGVEVSDPFGAGIETANGRVVARRATIKTMELGGITAADLPVVVADEFGDTNLLGMNFLARLGSWRVEGRTLILEPKRD